MGKKGVMPAALKAYWARKGGRGASRKGGSKGGSRGGGRRVTLSKVVGTALLILGGAAVIDGVTGGKHQLVAKASKAVEGVLTTANSPAGKAVLLGAAGVAGAKAIAPRLTKRMRVGPVSVN